MHHERSIGRGSHTTSSKVNHRQLAIIVYVAYQLVRGLQLLGCLVELILAHRYQATDFALHQAHVTHSLYYIAGTWFALSTNHGSPLGNTAQGLAKVLGTTHKGHIELGLIDMIDVIGWAEHLALVDIINLDGLQDLSLGNMTDTALGHHGNSYSLLDATNHLRVAHTANTSCCTDVGRNTFEGHYSAGTSLFGYLGLLGSSHVHYNTTLQHLS